MLSHYIAVGLGGAIGSVARVALGKLLPNFILGIPAPILLVNLLGCFLIGLLTELMALYWSASDHMRYFLVPGFLGGFTTFSSFALEVGFLYEKHFYGAAMLYATLSFLLCIAGFFIGMKLVRLFA